MKALVGFTNTLLSTCIVLSGILFITGKVTSAAYVQQAVEKSNINQGISEFVSNQLVQISAANTGLPQSTVEENISSVVSEAYINGKSSEIAGQVEQVLRGESSKLILDFSDLAAEAQANGLNVNTTDLKPIEITLPKNTSQSAVRTAQNLDLLRFISYSATIILAIAAVVFAALRRATAGLAGALLGSGLVFGVLALLSKLLDPILTRLIPLPESIQELHTYIDILIKTIVSDVSSFYATSAGILVLLAILLFILHRFLKPLRMRIASADSSSQAGWRSS